jgi:hypothetical protein
MSLSLQIHCPEFDFFSQLSNEAFAEMKEVMNGAGNVNIVPIDVVEEVSRIMFIFFFTDFHFFQKRRVTEIALKKGAQDEE